MSRRVTLVLCSGDGEVLGSLPPFPVGTPWWPDVEPVTEAARRDHGLEVLVLRMLTTTGAAGVMGGDVTYLAEVVGELPPALHLEPVRSAEDGDEEDLALRAAYARPGGLRRILEWADEVLEQAGTPRVARPIQVKTWNLSSVVRLPTTAGPVWCKSVPPFFAHEGAIIELVGAEDPDLVPQLVGADPTTRTILLRDVPGEDQWEPGEDGLLAMVALLVGLQARWAARVPALFDAGLEDWRAPALLRQLEALVARPSVQDTLDRDERAAAARAVEGLPDRLAALAECGLPDTLVHGDFHPGNWRSDGASLVLLDWGDSGIGHPLLDATAFLPRVPPERADAVAAAWAARWRAERPGSDPERALELVLPVAALRQALIYQSFLDGIERSERVYHQADVPDWIRRAIAARH